MGITAATAAIGVGIVKALFIFVKDEGCGISPEAIDTITKSYEFNLD